MASVSPAARVWPVSPAQKRLWVVNQMLEGESATAYNMPAAIRLRGPIDVELLQRSLDQLLARHEALRTTFSIVDDEPHQVVHASALARLERTDLTGDRDSERHAQELAAAHAAAVFDLENGPLVRLALISLTPLDHILLFNVHHIVFDEWSMSVLVSELSGLYQSLTAHRSASLPHLRIQYKDFASWQNKLMQSESMVAQGEYWRRKLAGSITALHIPADFPRPPSKSYSGRSIDVELDQVAMAQLVRFAASKRTTLFTCLVAVVKVLLFRYTGQEDIIVGCPIAGRDHPSLANQIGFYVNTLALRDQVRGQDSFSIVVDQVKQTVTEALENQSYPFDRLVSELNLERDVSRSPLFDVSVNLNPADLHERGLNLPGVAVSSFDLAFARAKVDLSFDFTETKTGIHLTIIYSTALFKEERIRNLARHFEQLISSCVRTSDRPVGLLDLLPADEKQQLVSGFSGRTQPCADEVTIVDFFEHQVSATPDYPAVRFNGVTLTYQELNRRANQLAYYLLARGVGPEVPVGVFMERSVSLIISLLGILKAGGAYLPLETTLPVARLSTILNNSFISIVLTETAVENKLPSFLGSVICTDAEGIEIGGEFDLNPTRRASPDNMAYIIYTSGSTGTPKGVVVEHSGLRNVAEIQKSLFQLRPGDRALQFASASFDASVFEFTQALCTGAELCIGTRDALMPGEALFRFLLDEHISIATLPPSALSLLPEGELPNLRTITVAGELCAPELVRRWSNGRKFFNLYGPTEATIWSTAVLYDSTPANPSIGKPISNVQVFILDPRLQPVPLGIPGEIFIGGAGVARGYLFNYDATAERFLPNPFSAARGSRMYRTGDLARWLSNGSIDFLGRLDDQVKVRGHRVELGEIEAVLAGHPSVRNAVVVYRQNGNGLNRILAYVVPGDEMPAASELRSWLRTRLPDYMMPSEISILHEFPVTPNGKVDRKNLPDPESTITTQIGFVAPRSDLESILSRIFADVLGRDRVGVTDNFFDIGGHSLLATQVISRVRETLRVDLPLSRIFQSATVADLANSLRSTDPERIDRIAKVIEKLRTMSDEEKLQLRATKAQQS